MFDASSTEANRTPYFKPRRQKPRAKHLHDGDCAVDLPTTAQTAVVARNRLCSWRHRNYHLLKREPWTETAFNARKEGRTLGEVMAEMPPEGGVEAYVSAMSSQSEHCIACGADSRPDSAAEFPTYTPTMTE
ncbi:MAG: hypothetical protein RIC14_07860 [Filomicrobium sp.]